MLRLAIVVLLVLGVTWCRGDEALQMWNLRSGATNGDDFFGSSVAWAPRSQMVASGAPGHKNGAGEAFAFLFTGQDFSSVALSPSLPANTTARTFGWSVAAGEVRTSPTESRECFVVGAPSLSTAPAEFDRFNAAAVEAQCPAAGAATDRCGWAFLFCTTASSSLPVELVRSFHGPAMFGYSVALHDGCVAVGSPCEGPTHQGGVHVFCVSETEAEKAAGKRVESARGIVTKALQHATAAATAAIANTVTEAAAWRWAETTFPLLETDAPAGSLYGISVAESRRCLAAGGARATSIFLACRPQALQSEEQLRNWTSPLPLPWPAVGAAGAPAPASYSAFIGTNDPTLTPEAMLGFSVAISPSSYTLVAGAPRAARESGLLFLFRSCSLAPPGQRLGDEWMLPGRPPCVHIEAVRPQDAALGARFGASVEYDSWGGGCVAVGAPGANYSLETSRVGMRGDVLVRGPQRRADLACGRGLAYRFCFSPCLPGRLHQKLRTYTGGGDAVSLRYEDASNSIMWMAIGCPVPIASDGGASGGAVGSSKVGSVTVVYASFFSAKAPQRHAAAAARVRRPDDDSGDERGRHHSTFWTVIAITGVLGGVLVVLDVVLHMLLGRRAKSSRGVQALVAWRQFDKTT